MILMMYFLYLSYYLILIKIFFLIIEFPLKFENVIN